MWIQSIFVIVFEILLASPMSGILRVRFYFTLNEDKINFKYD